ncbi:caspase-14-like [Polyodon spathula]|nr:caspase-14-like [Polyodon spathula]
MSGRREAYIVCVKERRPGAEEDLQIMKKLLLDYKFTCHELVDPSAKGIIEGLREFRDELNGKKENVSCCFVVIMAHGRLGQIVGRDGEAVSLEAVFELFDNKQCSALREKPKVFIVQACRGESNFPGFNNADATKHGTPISEDRLPINSDTLSVYATIPGGAALRSKKRGSPMFNEMANIFPKYADKCHIYELFTKVNRRLNEVDFSEFYEKDTERVAVRREALALRNRKGLENRDSSGLTLHICSNLVKRVYLAP